MRSTAAADRRLVLQLGNALLADLIAAGAEPQFIAAAIGRGDLRVPRPTLRALADLLNLEHGDSGKRRRTPRPKASRRGAASSASPSAVTIRSPWPRSLQPLPLALALLAALHALEEVTEEDFAEHVRSMLDKLGNVDLGRLEAQAVLADMAHFLEPQLGLATGVTLH